MKTVPLSRCSFVAVNRHNTIQKDSPFRPVPVPSVCPGSRFYCTEAFELETDLQLEVHGRQLTCNKSLPLLVSGPAKGYDIFTEGQRKEHFWWWALLWKDKSDSLWGTETQGGCSASCPTAHLLPQETWMKPNIFQYSRMKPNIFQYSLFHPSRGVSSVHTPRESVR